MPNEQPEEHNQMTHADTTDTGARKPKGPDIDLRRARAGRRRQADSTVLIVIATGGAIGAAARYLTSQAWPTPAGGFPAATLAINLAGCALIGVLMVLVTELSGGRQLIRAFLGTGVLGGFTTFSTYTLDVQRLLTAAHLGTALLYLSLTPIGAILAVWVTTMATRRMLNWRIR